MQPAQPLRSEGSRSSVLLDPKAPPIPNAAAVLLGAEATPSLVRCLASCGGSAELALAALRLLPALLGASREQQAAFCRTGGAAVLRDLISTQEGKTGERVGGFTRGTEELPGAGRPKKGKGSFLAALLGCALGCACPAGLTLVCNQLEVGAWQGGLGGGSAGTKHMAPPTLAGAGAGAGAVMGTASDAASGRTSTCENLCLVTL
jgi:hypothetical protein